MSLLGTPLLIALIVLAIVTPIATGLAWSRVRGSVFLRTGQRYAMVAVCQLVAVALIAVALNDYGDFYSSWSNLMHAQAKGTTVSSVPERGGGTSYAPNTGPSANEVRGSITLLGDAPFANPSQWSTRGRLESVTMHGPASALSEHAFVYLPPQYFQPAYAHSRFPAVEVMSGYPGAEGDMVTGMNYPGVLLALITQRRARPTVLVMLLPDVTYPRDTECTNVPAGPQAETFYDVDLPGLMSTQYRVLPLGWGAIGGSTGGYCAVKVAMMRPTTFVAAVAIQGYFTALKDGTTGDLWGGSATVRETNDLEWRLQHLPAPPISVLLVSSRTQTGPNGYRDTERFAGLVTAPMSARTILRPTGEHNIATWRIGLPDELAWLIAALPAPTPLSH